jgi:O-methyltransferase
LLAPRFPRHLYPADEGDLHHKRHELGVSLEEVKENFARVRLLDDRVIFLRGWFRDTLPRLRDERWALIRLDGDLYESITDGLVNLYPNLQVGGCIIVDDYFSIAACRKAVDHYRREHRIDEPFEAIDQVAVCWQRKSPS